MPLLDYKPSPIPNLTVVHVPNAWLMLIGGVAMSKKQKRQVHGLGVGD